MSTVDIKLAESLSARDTELIPHLDYLLQDIWELGASAEDVIWLIKKYLTCIDNLRILDLACFKGAVSVKLAKALKATVKGIDIMPKFIENAKLKAINAGVGDYTEFIINDINKALMDENDYDIVIFGAAGDILGNNIETLKKLSLTVKDKGYIVLDDAASPDGKAYPSRKDWMRIFEQASLNLIGEKPMDENELIKTNRFNQDAIIQRAEELMRQYPEKTSIFKSYIESQQEECDMLESELTCYTWLLQKR